MTRAGIIVLVLTGVLGLLPLGLWLLGLVFGVTAGGLIHLLLLLGLVVVPSGVIAGVVLLVLGSRGVGRR